MILQKRKEKKIKLLEHISYSSLKVWNECPHKHKLVYVEKIKKFTGNIFTAFGKALHESCELLLKEASDVDAKFDSIFDNEISLLDEDVREEISESTIQEFKKQGKEIIPFVVDSLGEYFGDFELLKTEEELFEIIDIYDDYERKFKGFIDLVIKTSDGKIHILDWKTCSWGWDLNKKADPITSYQLTLYKHFYAKKHGIDPSDIETYFALLKRTSQKDRVEIFRVTSGKVKTNNALSLLDKALYNIDNGNYVKNKLSCSKCEFYRTAHCP